MNQLFCTDYVRYTPGPNRSGGMLVSPVLVWSRMYSLGRGQLFQGMYVVGQKMDNEEIPDLAGVWLGNNTLDKLADQNFAFYWDDNGPKGRLQKGDLQYGTQGGKASGNPFLAKRIEGYRWWTEPFPTPLCNLAEGSGFCMSYSLSNQSAFGCYAPIMNGVDRRPNWRVISLPKDADEGAEVRTKLERKKISGGEDRMEASGRGYGRLMGLIEYNGERNGSRERPRWKAAVNAGDEVKFNIMRKRYDEELYEDSYKDDGDKFKVEVSVEDLVNESEADRAAADDALQVGEEFMINKSRFRVIERDDDPFEMERDNVRGNGSYAILKCIEDRNRFKYKIGFVSRDYYGEDIPKKDSKYDIFERQHVPPHWSPLLKYEIGSFRNLRPAEVTEIGIKSRVYAQMNGMCNFPTIPTSNELRDDFDKQNVTFQNGVQTQYFTRYSFFTLYMRDTEDGDPSDPSTFRDTEVIFAIKGTEPVDQYNYIAIKPQTAKQYEYRLYPLNSGWCGQVDDDDVAWELDAANGDPFTIRKTVSKVGNVEISSAGRLINIKCVWTSPLMLGKRSKDYSDNERAYCPLDDCEAIAPPDEWDPNDCVPAPSPTPTPSTTPTPTPEPTFAEILLDDQDDQYPGIYYELHTERYIQHNDGCGDGSGSTIQSSHWGRGWFKTLSNLSISFYYGDSCTTRNIGIQMNYTIEKDASGNISNYSSAFPAANEYYTHSGGTDYMPRSWFCAGYRVWRVPNGTFAGAPVTLVGEGINPIALQNDPNYTLPATNTGWPT